LGIAFDGIKITKLGCLYRAGLKLFNAKHTVSASCKSVWLNIWQKLGCWSWGKSVCWNFLWNYAQTNL